MEEEVVGLTVGKGAAMNFGQANCKRRGRGDSHEFVSAHRCRRTTTWRELLAAAHTPHRVKHSFEFTSYIRNC
jgi:hypothetical protein